MSGQFDVGCKECGGSGKVETIDEDRLTETQRKAFDLWQNEQFEAYQDSVADAQTRWAEGGWAQA
jgi:hypothetical protein